MKHHKALIELIEAVPATDKSVFVFRPAATFERVNHKLIKDVAAVTTRASVFAVFKVRCKASINGKKVVERNPLRIVTAEDEANIFESAFKTIDTRFVLHPQTPFCAFPLQVVMQFTTFPTWSVCIAHHLLERGLHQTADIHSLYALLGHISSPELLQRVVTQTAG